MRLQQRRNVDLPQPEGPISAVTMPARITRSTSCSAWNLPYQRLRSLASIAGTFAAAAITAVSCSGLRRDSAKAALQVVDRRPLARAAAEQILGRGDLDAAAAEEHRGAVREAARLLH